MKNVVVTLSIVAMAAASLALAGHAGAQSGATTWATQQQNPQRTGISTLAGPGSTSPQVVYKLPACSKAKSTDSTCTFFPVNSAPAISSGGNVYFGADDGNLYGYHVGPTTYTSLGGFPVHLDAPIRSAPTLSSDGSVLYVGTDSGSLYAISTSNGAMKWAHPFSAKGFIRASPLLNSDGSIVIVAAGDGVVYGVKTADGTQAWKSDKVLGGPILSSPALTTDGTTAYVGGADDEVHSINVTSGATGVSAQAAGPFNETPSLDSSANQYIGNPDGYLYSYNTSGSTNWDTLIGGALSSTALSASSVYVAAVPPGLNEAPGELYSVHTTDGSITWKQVIDGQVAEASAPVVDSAGNVYVATVTGNVYGFTSAGTKMWELSEPGVRFAAGLAIGANGWLYAPGSDGNVYVIGQFSALPPPPTPPSGTITPIATSIPGTSTPVTTVTPSGTATATKTPVIAGLKVTVKVRNHRPSPGQRETIYGRVSVGLAKVRIVIRYPNGNTTVHKLKAKKHGKYSWGFVVRSSEITRTNRHVQVRARTTASSRHAQATTRFLVKFGPVDVSAEPRTVRSGARETIWIHSQARTRISSVIAFPTGRSMTVHGKTPPSGWFRHSFKVPPHVTTYRHIAHVYVWAGAGRKLHYTGTTFKVK